MPDTFWGFFKHITGVISENFQTDQTFNVLAYQSMEAFGAVTVYSEL